MSSKRYTDEFKAEAVKQVTDRGRTVDEVATTLGVGRDSLYAWVRNARQSQPALQMETEHQKQIRRLESELRRVIEERDILEKAAAYFAKVSR